MAQGHGVAREEAWQQKEPTPTSREQDRVERLIVSILKSALRDEDVTKGRVVSAHQYPFEDYVEDPDASIDDFDDDYDEEIGVGLYRLQHASYASRGLRGLPVGYSSLDASRPWLCYWILNALDLLNALPAPASIPSRRPPTKLLPSSLPAMTSRVVDFLKRCQSPTGGFCGGPGQLPHMAATYAAVNALVIIGTEEAYRAIDRPNLYAFLLGRKLPDGSFTMHENGEVDIRGTYCALAAAALANVLTDELVAGTAHYVTSCQTYEGGIGGEPGNEAHGGYSYCGVSAMTILGELHRLDLQALARWTCERQVRFEGGFQGRTNKLVDSCYSFWQAAVFPQIQPLLPRPSSSVTLRATIQSVDDDDDDDDEHQGLREAGQQNKKRKEIEKRKDDDEDDDNEAVTEEIRRATPGEECEGDLLFDQLAVQAYILACCQDLDGGLRDKPPKFKDYYHTCYALAGLAVTQHNEGLGPTCLGGRTTTDLLKRIDPTYGVSVEKVLRAKRFFKTLPPMNAGRQ